MFKGLRTKIESEQKIQSGNKKPENPHLPKNDNSITKLEHQTGQLRNEISNKHLEFEEIGTVVKSDKNSVGQNPSAYPSADIDKKLASNPSLHSSISPKVVNVISNQDQGSLDAADLSMQISSLREQLKTVMKEKEESNDQNTQLYQLIEKLRRNLEDEKEANVSLRSRLNETEIKISEYKLQDRPNNSSVESKSLNTDLLSDKECTANNIEDLRGQVLDLQAQLKKKTRLLRIKEQNLNDIKKTLQREIFEHGKTQEELIKTQKLIKESTCQCRNTSPNPNGCMTNDSDDILDQKIDFVRDKTTKVIIDSSSNLDVQSNSSFVTSDRHIGEDAISLSAGGVATNVQLDRLSYLSHSSASIDESESHDLQQNNFSREVNHEYLRNVLFRYMTSTDTETTQHLVKAISVLMDFSPEQSSAIRNVMSARSSWLRLK